MSQALTAWMAPAAQQRWSSLSFSGLLEALRHERLLPLALAEADARADALLQPLHEQLEQDARLRIAQEDSLLVRTLDAFSAKGCRALLLKGVALGRWLYPRAGLRPATDVDLLIEPGQRFEAHASLIGAGLLGDAFSQYDEAACQASYCENAGSRQLDLHWAISVVPELACRFRFEELWKRSIELGRPAGARALCRVDALMHAVVHYRAHLPANERPAMWLHDVALLVRGLSEAEWGDLDRRVREARLAGLHAATLSEAAAWFPLDLPAARIRTWAGIGPQEPTRHWLQPHPSSAWRFLRSLLGLPGLRLRLHFLRVRLFPSRRWMAGRYGARGPAALMLAYFRRWFSGLRQLTGSDIDRQRMSTANPVSTQSPIHPT